MVPKVHQALDETVSIVRDDALGSAYAVQLGLVAVDENPGAILNVLGEVVSKPHLLRAVRPGAKGMPGEAGDCNDTAKSLGMSGGKHLQQ